MHEEHRLTELDSGLRIVTEHMDSVRSVALGFWIGTGSVGESTEEAGLSHLVEHMLFRGTERFGSLEIDQLFDTLGAELNAGTGKETTSVYTRVIDEHLDEAFDVMADMVWRPRFAGSDLDNERQIVLEEIAMYEDDPQDKVFDVLGEAVFGEHPLGRPIIGRAEVVGGVSPTSLSGFHAARYVPGNVVISAAGHVDHDALVAMVIKAEAERAGAIAPSTPGPPEAMAQRTLFIAKPTEQVHVTLGAPGIARDDDRRFALRVLDNIFGGTSSSRLFQEVRESRGLAYAVYSFQSLYAATGQVGLYLGTRPDNVREALEVVAAELARLRSQPATEEELHRSKENVKGRMVLALESTGARMNRLGSSVLAGMPLLTVDEVIERIEAVSLADLEGLATELYAPDRLSVAGIGPDEGAFRAALEPLAVAV
ncbi:MAG: pitrilysin family protein [Solirubrobacteraceae bacterium]